MRSLNIYRFSELSEEAKKKAIHDVREELKENTPHGLVFDWAIDNCELFEPSHQVMCETFGDQYSDDLGGDFLLRNLRKDIILRDGNLHVTVALKITNQDMFKTWIGFPKFLHKYIICSVIGMDEDPSTLDVEILLGPDDPREEIIRSFVGVAEKAFDKHMKLVERRIINGIEEYFSDDNLSETISANDNYEFLGDGKLYNS
jgi:hypothetical protein